MTTSPSKHSPAVGPRRRTRARRLPLAAAVAAVVVLGTGCGDGEPDDRGERVLTDDVSERSASAITTGAALREVADQTAAAQSGRMEMHMLTEGEDGFGVDVTGEYSGDVSHMTLGYDLPEGPNDPTTNPDHALFGTNEMITTAEATYVKGDLATMFGADPDTWYELPFGGEGGLAGAVPGLAAGAVDPDTVLSLLQGADGDVENLGTEDLRGESCDHLRVVTSLERIADGATEQLDDATESDVSDLRSMFEDELGAALPDDEIPVDVWVCEDGLIHKVEMTIGDEAPSEEGANAETTLSFEMYDLGADIAIEVPTDAEKLDFGDLLGGLGSMLDDIGDEPETETTD